MGSTICRSVNVNSNSRRSELKGSRFDHNSSFSKKSKLLKRSQIEPYGAKVASINTSYLNHKKSDISANQTNGLMEQLSCDYCTTDISTNITSSNGMIGNVSSTNRDHSSSPLGSSVPNSRSMIPISPFALPIESHSENNDSILPSPRELMVDEPDLNKSTIFPISEIPEIIYESSPINEGSDDNDDDPHSIDNVSDAELCYRSVSTIPLASDESEETSSEHEVDDEEAELLNLNNRMSQARSGSLDESVGSKFKRNYHIESIDMVEGGKQTMECETKNNCKKCSFCEFVKNGSGGHSWNDLDKDVSMLMETVDKLSTLISERDIQHGNKNINGKMYKIHEVNSKDTTNSSFDDTDEIVEERKVSLSFLEKCHRIELKERVLQLRNKRRVGISLMKTSRGKKLMVFNDGQNTYQIHGKLAI